MAGALCFGPADITVISTVHRRVVSDNLSGIPISNDRLKNQLAADWQHSALTYRKEHACRWAFVVLHSLHLSPDALHHADALADADTEAEADAEL